MTRTHLQVYAGIGSRRTPPNILELMVTCGHHLAVAGWTLRSGAAEGADAAFERGARDADGQCEIYLPWPTFNKYPHVPALTEPSDRAYEIASKYHPAWTFLKWPVRRLLARDVHQVLGANLDHPAPGILCWTPDGTLDGRGRDSGGTGMALRIAAGEAPDTVVFNLARAYHLERVRAFCDSPDSTLILG